jgi:hypothetical protein
MFFHQCENPEVMKLKIQITKLDGLYWENRITSTKIRLNRLRWFGYVQRMEENRNPERILYMNLETTRLRV